MYARNLQYLAKPEIENKHNGRPRGYLGFYFDLKQININRREVTAEDIAIDVLWL